MGVMANNNLVYLSESLRKYGYIVCVVPWIIPEHERRVIKYDMDIRSYFPRLYKHWLGQRILIYGFFIWSVIKFDVFITPFLNRLLDRTTFLKWWEFQLLKIAKNKSILNPYGSDVHTPSLKWKDQSPMLSIYEGWVRDPNYNKTNEGFIEKNRIYCEKNADCIIAALDLVDYLKRIDYKIQLRCINTDIIQPKYVTQNAVLKILHAPNHRHLKGTDELIKAVDEINSSTKLCDLRIAEAIPNTELMKLIEEADIIADQFLVGAYGRFAIESMARGKPVLCYLREDLSKIYYQWSESGIINTTVYNIKEKLNYLIHQSQETRANIGKVSRNYVEKYHSYQFIGSTLNQIIQNVTRK